MSLRDLVDADCGGANALMRLGSHFAQDIAHKEDGISRGFGAANSFYGRDAIHGEASGADQLVNEFLGQSGPMHPPQTFRMDALLQEMREIDAGKFSPQHMRAPAVIEEVRNEAAWANEFRAQESTVGPLVGIPGVLSSTNLPMAPRHDQLMAMGNTKSMVANDFFNSMDAENLIPPAAGHVLQAISGHQDQFKYSEFMRFMRNVNDGQVHINNGNVSAEDFFTAHEVHNADQLVEKAAATAAAPDWARDFEMGKQGEFEQTQDYNSQFWNRLQNEWQKISDEDDTAHPWLSDFNDFFDPYKEYEFDKDNPMQNIENAFEKGKALLESGDIPSAVYCFESAVKQDPDNATIWEFLGISQAENEKDPNAIAALNRSLALQPSNPKVIMALAVSYTNESLQNPALNMLLEWLKCNPDYKHLVPSHLQNSLKENTDDPLAKSSTVIRGPDLNEVQNLFLQAVHLKHPTIDPDIQEALGVLFNLSTEYDKAVDCFQAALHVRSDSAKTWNRLGASLANGNRSVEAVEAYQQALRIQPGFIRARYNVGIICINLKAYKEATEHFLTALNHQSSSMVRSGLGDGSPTSQMSDTIWSTMRMAISLLGRLDLMPAVDKRELSALNEAFQQQ